MNALKYKHYTSVLNLGYQPLIDYVQDYFVEYITNIVLAIDTNENEELNALEDIIERLMPESEELCFEVLEKEKVVWDDIKFCCKDVGEEVAQSKKKMWDFLLSHSRLRCTWENFIAYRSQYGSVNPAGIVGAGIAATAVSTLVAVVYCKVMDRKRRI